MTNAEAIGLMHAVLDGAAGAEDKAALERLLATDPAAHAEFESLRRLFEALSQLPQRQPPADLADGVLAALQRRNEISPTRRQPFSTSGVIGPSGSDIIVRKPAATATTTRTPSGSNFGSQHMSTSRRGLWITGGVAAAVAALFLGGGIQFPTSGEHATGTIAPAQRIRAQQPGSADVKVGEPSGGSPSGSSTGASNQPGAENGAANAAQSGAQNSAQNSAQNAAQSGAQNAAQNAAQNSAQNAAQNAAQSGAQNAAQNAAQNSAQNAAQNAAQSGARNAAQNAAQNSAQNSAQNAAQNAAQSAGR